MSGRGGAAKAAAKTSAAGAASLAGVDRERAKHLALGQTTIRDGEGASVVTVNEAESPLAWLARRKGREGTAGR